MTESGPAIPATAHNQVSVAEMVDEDWDVVVIGAGPGGSAAAIELARKGCRVLLLDRHRFPREKVCGDALTDRALRALEHLGMEEEVRRVGRPIGTLSVVSPAGIEVDLPEEYVLLRRQLLDDLLARQAVRQGAVFACGTAIEVRHSGRRAGHEILLQGEARTLRTRSCLLATGSQVRLARRLQLVPPQSPSGVAMRCYVRSGLPLERLVVAFARDILPGYAWIFPVEPGLFNVGCGLFRPLRHKGRIHLRQAFDRFLRNFDLARRLLETGDIVSPLRGALLYSGWEQARAVAPGGLLGVGEVIGTTSPFTGEGVGQAMQCGLLAGSLLADALGTGDFSRLEDYPRQLRRLAELHTDGYLRAERWMTRPWLVDLVLLRARCSPRLRDKLNALLREASDPAQVFSWGGVWRSFWR